MLVILFLSGFFLEGAVLSKEFWKLPLAFPIACAAAKALSFKAAENG
jgi:hypothetical protein